MRNYNARAVLQAATVDILKLSAWYIFICIFILLLPEGQAGPAWQPSNRVTFFLPPPGIAMRTARSNIKVCLCSAHILYLCFIRIWK